MEEIGRLFVEPDARLDLHGMRGGEVDGQMDEADGQLCVASDPTQARLASVVPVPSQRCPRSPSDAILPGGAWSGRVRCS